MKTTLLLLLALTIGAVPAAAATPTELYQQSFALESAGSYEDALKRMDQLAATGSADYLLHLRRGWLLYLNGRYVDAVGAYEQAAVVAPTSVEALLGRTLPLMAVRQE